eukprot:s119_g22.t1
MYPRFQFSCTKKAWLPRTKTTDHFMMLTVKHLHNLHERRPVYLRKKPEAQTVEEIALRVALCWHLGQELLQQVSIEPAKLESDWYDIFRFGEGNVDGELQAILMDKANNFDVQRDVPTFRRFSDLREKQLLGLVSCIQKAPDLPTEKAAELLCLLDADVWGEGSLNLLKQELSAKVGSDTKERRVLQDYCNVTFYLDASWWTFLQTTTNELDALEQLTRLAGQLGFRCPSDHTHTLRWSFWFIAYGQDRVQQMVKQFRARKPQEQQTGVSQGTFDAAGSSMHSQAVSDGARSAANEYAILDGSVEETPANSFKWEDAAVAKTMPQTASTKKSLMRMGLHWRT